MPYWSRVLGKLHFATNSTREPLAKACSFSSHCFGCLALERMMSYSTLPQGCTDDLGPLQQLSVQVSGDLGNVVCQFLPSSRKALLPSARSWARSSKRQSKCCQRWGGTFEHPMPHSLPRPRWWSLIEGTPLLVHRFFLHDVRPRCGTVPVHALMCSCTGACGPRTPTPLPRRHSSPRPHPVPYTALHSCGGWGR